MAWHPIKLGKAIRNMLISVENAGGYDLTNTNSCKNLSQWTKSESAECFVKFW